MHPIVPNLCSAIANSSKRNIRQLAVPYSNASKSILDILYNQGLITSYVVGDVLGPFTAHVPLTPDNINNRRLWVFLKYRQGEPALQMLKCVSKPSRRIFASADEVRALASAKRVNSLIKRQVLGQITILNTPYGIVELSDAVKKNVGGEVLCMAN